jgi:hypothetical protein
MFLHKKGQSTAEYAIVIGLVIAVTAGILQATLKGGITQKHKQGMNYMLTAGNDELGSASEATTPLYTQEFRKTVVDSGDYEDVSVMKKGGLEEKKQVQTTETTAVSIETIKEAEQPD